MKAYILLFFAFFYINFVFSQIEHRGVVTYNFTIPIKDPTFSNQKNAILYFNISESLFVYDKNGMDSINRKNELKINENNGGARIRISPSDEKGKIIYRNFKTKKISFRVTEKKPLDPFTVDDNWVEINWKIFDEYKSIEGIESQKAIGEFRGRVYTAWFATEIPLPYGPWKLFGLPGLILEAEDEEQKFIVKLKNLCYPCGIEMEEIKKPFEKENKTMEEYVHFMDHLLENVEKKMQEKLPKNKNISITLMNPPSEEDIKIDREFNIEKRYEWEKNDNEKDNF